ncbi:MAG: phosphoenolpyruvate--protein phosphotransferase [Thiogranum sp.]
MSRYEPQKKPKVGKLVSLQRIVQEVSCAPDLPAASRIVVKHVRETMHTDVCSIYLTESTTGALALLATEGLNPAAIGKVRLDSDQGLVGLVATNSAPVNVRDAARHPRFKLIPQCEETPYHGFLGVPVIHRGETLGVIVVQQAKVRRYRDTDVAFLVTLAAQLAGVITLARASGAADLFAINQHQHEHYVDAIAGAPGVASGVGVVAYSPAELDSVPDRIPQDPHAEEAAFHAAVRNVVNELHRLQTDFGNTLLPQDLALFEALAMIASSDMLVEATVERIHAGNWAPGALRDTIDEYADQFMAIDDGYLRERARDIRDIGRRILAHLLQSGDAQRHYPARTILVGEDLGPIDLGKVPVDRLAGVISGHGSSLSHLAILARAMGIPAVVGTAGLVPLSQLEAAALIVDGYRGRLYVNPGHAVRQEFSRLERQEQALSRELENLRDLPAETLDGFRVALYTNAGILEDLTQSLSVGAEGIGLYRTELPFMLHEQFPGEEEQRNLYRQVLEAFAPNPVTLRTLDVGGDKTLPYFPVTEPNPALGWRGIRFALDNPVIFITQLRAMLRASAGLENLRILIPMVGSVDEAEEAVQLVRRSWQELKYQGEEVTLPPCGLMIEVPSAVYQAAALARRVDFLSIGTNDLTQYLLAVDRGNERVAARFDSLHPAVIRALQQVMEAAEQYKKPVSVCGQAAGDPAMAILLVGMGIHSLSLSAADLPRIKSVIRTVTRAQAQSLLSEALQIEKAAEIRKLLSGVLIQAGLGGLVRAGK